MDRAEEKLTKKQTGISIILALLLITLLIKPELSNQAAMRGLTLWWQVVAPALLPFFIIAELLIRLGAAETAGRALRPLMLPLFFLPGAASLAVMLGFCSGFPTGAAVTASLWREGLVDTAEGERLIAFTNNAGPLYISVALATGLFGCPQAAVILALAHYGGNLLLGMALGLPACRRAVLSRGTPPPRRPPAASQSLGAILRAAAETAIRNILLIACYMVFFSVITALLIPAAWAEAHPLAAALLQGCFEMTLGLDTLADAGLPLAQSLPLAAAILAFGGFSVQVQVMAMVADTPIRAHRYLLCRLLHTLLSLIIAGLLCPLFELPLAAASLPTPAITPPISAYLGLCLLALALWLLLAICAAPFSRRRR